MGKVRQLHSNDEIWEILTEGIEAVEVELFQKIKRNHDQRPRLLDNLDNLASLRRVLMAKFGPGTKDA